MEDGMVYIDVSAYPPPVQTPPSPEWMSGSLPISLSPSVVPLPILSPMIPLTVPSPVATPAMTETEGFLTELGAQVEMQEGMIRDHAVRLEELLPDLFESGGFKVAAEMVAYRRGVADLVAAGCDDRVVGTGGWRWNGGCMVVVMGWVATECGATVERGIEVVVWCGGSGCCRGRCC
ncbi:hypothetical protein Tco_1237218 [Tanacetum coccineum]